MVFLSGNLNAFMLSSFFIFVFIYCSNLSGCNLLWTSYQHFCQFGLLFESSSRNTNHVVKECEINPKSWHFVQIQIVSFPALSSKFLSNVILCNKSFTRISNGVMKCIINHLVIMEKQLNDIC